MRLQRIIQRSLLLLLLLTCTACGAQAPAEPEQPPAPPDAASSEPVYTNLDSAASSREGRDLLTAAGLEEERIDTVLAWAGDFNDCMRACPSFSLAGEFTALEGGVADYGDYLVQNRRPELPRHSLPDRGLPACAAPDHCGDGPAPGGVGLLG